MWTRFLPNHSLRYRFNAAAIVLIISTTLFCSPLFAAKDTDKEQSQVLFKNVNIFDGKSNKRQNAMNVIVVNTLIKLGVIEVGAYADILLVDGNSPRDIRVIGGTDKWIDADPEYKSIETLKVIMKNGKIYKNTL